MKRLAFLLFLSWIQRSICLTKICSVRLCARLARQTACMPSSRPKARFNDIVFNIERIMAYLQPSISTCPTQFQEIYTPDRSRL